MTIEEILPLFKNKKKSGKGFLVICPGHDDKEPSLSVSEGSDRKVLLNCHAGCSTARVLRAIGLEMKDLFPDTQSRIIRLDGNRSKASLKVKNVVNKPREIVAVYDYTDETGTLLYQNVRYQPKHFGHRRPNGKGGYIYNLDGVQRVPYYLPELLDTMGSGDAKIRLTEGEKDADRLRSLGIVATSFKKWTESFNQHIEGSHALLFRDHDTSGVAQANDAARIIARVAKSVKVIDLFDGEPIVVKHGKDVSDWIEARRSEGLDDDALLRELAVVEDRAVIYTEELDEQLESKNGHFQFSFTTLDDLYGEPEEETAYVWDRTFPLGGFSIISAKPKVGKSTVLRNLAVAISRGEPFLGRDTLKGKVLYLCLEEKRNEVRKHFEMMHADGDMILIHTGKGAQSTDETIEALKAAIVEFEPVIVFVDPLSRVLRHVDFNDYKITYALEPFIDLARKSNVHLCALHHDGKGEREGGDAILGSTALFGSVDCHISMKKRKDGRTISSTQRYGDDLAETVIELDKETGLILDKGDLQSAILAEVKAEVLGVIGSEWIEGKDIRGGLSNRKGGLVSKAISSLLAAGAIDRSGGGKRNDPYRYGIGSGDLRNAELC